MCIRDRIFLGGLFGGMNVIKGQAFYGTTGLLHAPTAVMQKDKTVMLGGNMPVSYTHLDVYKRQEDILLFSMEYGHPSCSIGNTLKNPSKASACSQTPYPLSLIHI